MVLFNVQDGKRDGDRPCLLSFFFILRRQDQRAFLYTAGQRALVCFYLSISELSFCGGRLVVPFLFDRGGILCQLTCSARSAWRRSGNVEGGTRVHVDEKIPCTFCGGEYIPTNSRIYQWRAEKCCMLVCMDAPCLPLSMVGRVTRLDTPFLRSVRLSVCLLQQFTSLRFLLLFLFLFFTILLR